MRVRFVSFGIFIAVCLVAASAYAQGNYHVIQTLPGRSTSGLIQATDGNFYGTTADGGSFGVGTIFRMSPAGGLTILYSFTGGGDGASPGALTQANDGALYGSAHFGGDWPALPVLGGDGTFFRITPDGTFTTLHVLTGAPYGACPNGPLIEASDGYLYGATGCGGASNHGTVVRLTTDGDYSVLYSFPGGIGGQTPLGILEGSDGDFYGTTGGFWQIVGGYPPPVDGTAFRMTRDGDVSILHQFAPGSFGVSPLAQGLDGSFYGWSADTGVFRLTPDGTFAVVHTFSQSDGGFAIGDSPTLLAAGNGALCGTTAIGGPSGGGTLYRIALDGTFTVLHAFSCDHIHDALSTLIHGADGNFYGIADGCTESQTNSVVYRLDNPDPCDATVAVHYTPGTLNLGLTLRTPTPAFAGVWLFTANEQTKLWSSAVPAIDPAISATAAIPISNAGPLGVLSLLTDVSGHLACFDWRVVSTGP